MTPHNLHAVLVHESRDCVVDLVRNLHHLDPASKIVLYNGGPDPELLSGRFPWENYGAVVHPSPRRMKWGWLHEFALDCMRFGFELGGFDTITIVDSDQLGVRAGYSQFLFDWLAGRTGVGLLGSAPPPVPGKPAAPPAVQAYREYDLWRPFLRRFPQGEQKFAHWTFWPSTVFTQEAARGLLEVWKDSELQSIVSRTKIWASEEVILPTLVALLGLSVEVNPCRHDFVRYRVQYSSAQLESALAQANSYWIHPIPRTYEHPLRARIRHRFDDYSSKSPSAPREAEPAPTLLLTLPILAELRTLEGWLSDEEADLLMATARAALEGDGAHHVVEVGSYCGKATVALGRVAKAVAPSARICSIDLHDGIVGSRDGKLEHTAPTRVKLERNLRNAGLEHLVDVRQCRSQDVDWSSPIRLLLVDGLHDYESVAADFAHFEPFVESVGYAAFHDYADYYPGVRVFVDELLATGAWLKVAQSGTLVVLRRAAAIATGDAQRSVVRLATPDAPPMPNGERIEVNGHPLVSCIMPTADRHEFVAHAIRHFKAQTYANCELIIVDDGAAPIADLIPADPLIRYMRLSSRSTIGEKRNIACRAARGNVIVHWDDDDWSSPSRVAIQVSDLEQTGADIVGLRDVHYFEPSSLRSWQYRYPHGARAWVAGNTLVYRKSLWERNPFDPINVGEDARFIWASRSVRVSAHEDPSFFVATLHGRNAGKKQVQHRFWHPQSPEVVHALMGADFEVYQSLFGAVRARSAAG